MTNGIVIVRQMLDPSWPGPPNKPQDVLSTSAAYGLYMSVSSNLRYQIIAGKFVVFDDAFGSLDIFI